MAICNYRVHGIPSYGCIFYNHLGVQYIYTYAVGFTAHSIQSHESFQMNSSIDRKVCISTFWRRRKNEKMMNPWEEQYNKMREWNYWCDEHHCSDICCNDIVVALWCFFYSKLQQTFFLQRLVKMARQNSLGWHLKFALKWWESEGKRERNRERLIVVSNVLCAVHSCIISIVKVKTN